MTNPPCPACNSDVLQPFYGPMRVPTQSNLLLRTVEEALAQPTAEVELAVCPACGFILNTRFDAASQQLDNDYEATQAFSGTFSDFSRTLAAGWIARYALGPGKTALEIGCGRGEFIEQLGSLSGCSAIGIDPIAEPDRHNGATLIRGYFPNDLDAHADFICCRHTLEHIADVEPFVHAIRRNLGDRRDVAVCFEVPDTLRVLHEAAFWDIYYEHCSYFTPGSLARLFRKCGLAIRDLRLEFDGQYLILEAMPTDATTLDTHPLEEAPANVATAIATFTALFEKKRTEWLDVIRRARQSGARVALWGSGSKAVGFLTTLGIDRSMIELVVDINPHKQNTYLPTTGQQIVAPERLVEHQPSVVIAMNPIYRSEIRTALDALGLRDTQLLAL